MTAKPTNPEPDDGIPPISPLMADIVSHMFAQNHATTDAIIANLEKQLDDARALLAAVEDGVIELISGPYAPSTAAIRGALFPPEEKVDLYRRRDEQ